jgi:hypothetical protein
VLLGPMEAHASGVRMWLLTVSRRRDIQRALRPEGQADWRFGVEFSDGRTAESHRHSWPYGDVYGGPVLLPGGGWGGGNEFRQEFWLWPLPPEGPVRFHLLWDDAGISERSIEVEAAVFIEAAAREELVWPPLTPEEERDERDGLISSMGDRSSGVVLRSSAVTAEQDEDSPTHP